MNVLAIGAHYDDIELGCGGSLVKHVQNNDNVLMYVLTDSEYGTFEGEILRTKKDAKKEGKAAAAILGVKNIICEGLPTKKLPYIGDLVERINHVIDENKIQCIYTHWLHDVNHDHAATGCATLTAARHVPRVLMYRSNWYITNAHFNNNFYIDISEFLDVKIKAIKSHKSEYKKFGENWIDFVKHQNRNSGIEMEVEYAESFELIKYLM